jgi:adenylate cyclase, class 2
MLMASDTAAAGERREIEVKLPINSVDDARRLIANAGFNVRVPRVFESNAVFDSEALTLRHSHSLLRLRQAGDRFTLTFKGPPLPGPHKSREEIETTVADAPATRAILERLGFLSQFRYDKYRTEFTRHGSPVIIALDETPIGIWMEVEGPPEWIDSTAAELTFTPSDYITASYFTLYEQHCREHNLVLKDMVFGETR